MNVVSARARVRVYVFRNQVATGRTHSTYDKLIACALFMTQFSVLADCESYEGSILGNVFATLSARSARCIVVVFRKNVFTTVFVTQHTHRDPRCIVRWWWWWARTSSWYSFWQSSRSREWRTTATTTATIILHSAPVATRNLQKYNKMKTIVYFTCWRNGERAADKNYGVKFAGGATVCRRFNFANYLLIIRASTLSISFPSDRYRAQEISKFKCRIHYYRNYSATPPPC